MAEVEGHITLTMGYTGEAAEEPAVLKAPATQEAPRHQGKVMRAVILPHPVIMAMAAEREEVGREAPDNRSAVRMFTAATAASDLLTLFPAAVFIMREAAAEAAAIT